jgi:hypothetical protein
VVNYWRTIVRVRPFATRMVVLLLLLPLWGCRDISSLEGTTSERMVQFHTGDRFLYNVWPTDAWGFVLDSLSSHHTWDVLTTAGQLAGYSDVVVLRDSIFFLRIGSTELDTLFLRAESNGTVMEYGFLARLVAQREGRVIPPSWDTLVDFRSPAWSVGALDSTGTNLVGAAFGNQPDYFSVTIDGVSTVFPADRAEMSGNAFDAFLWVSDSPPCFPRWEVEPDPFDDINEGSLWILQEARYAHFFKSSQSRTW